MTTPKGAAMLESLRSIQKFYSQVALLLRSAEEYLTSEKGLQGLHSKRTTGDTSKSLNSPHAWLPGGAARFFATRDQNVFVVVSVCLVDRPEDRFAIPLTEPLMSVGWVRFNQSCQLKDIPWDWSKMPHWTHHPRDGTISEWEATPAQQRKDGYLRQRCLTLPLMEISSTHELIKRCLDPLMASLPPSSV